MHTQALACSLYCGLLFHVALILVIKETSLKIKKAFSNIVLALTQSSTTLCDLKGFPRQELWAGLPFPTQRILLNLCFKPRFLQFQIVGDFTTAPGKPNCTTCSVIAYLLYKGKDSTLDRFMDTS